jgi:cell division protease FtsH
MSKQPSSPPPGDKPVPTAPPPPPGWRHWLWPIALIVMLGLYFFLPGIVSTTTETLSYSQFQTDAASHQVKTVQLSSPSNGSNTTITGALRNGKNFATVGPPDTSALSTQLKADGAAVTYSTPSSSLGSTLLYLLVIFAPLIIVFWLFRRMSRASGGAAGLQGILGVGRSRARSSTPSGRAPSSPTWLATRARRKRSPRSWTSSATLAGTSGPGRWRRAAC